MLQIMQDEVSETENIRKNLAIERMIVEGCDILLDVNQTFVRQGVRMIVEGYDILLLGIPTWYYGEAQCDWDDFFPTLEEVDFNGKLVALFGCGET